MPNMIDLSGKRFGRLTISHRLPRIKRRGNVRWFCVCDCGGHTVSTGDKLTIGHTRSCGCLQVESVIRKNHSHGAAQRKQASREYRAWNDMKTRCRRDKNYKGRVSVCTRWKNDFQAFLKDMGKCPPSLTLDRIDNDGNYEPGNCRWTTNLEQQRNKRKRSSTKFV